MELGQLGRTSSKSDMEEGEGRGPLATFCLCLGAIKTAITWIALITCKIYFGALALGLCPVEPGIPIWLVGK